MKALKYGLLALGVLTLAVAVLASYLIATFDARDYEKRISQFVQDRTGRTLTIRESTKISFWPDAVLEVRGVSISERGSEEPFAHLVRARIALDLRALVSGALRVNAVELDGASVHIVRFADGRLNVDDLLGDDTRTARIALGRIAMQRSHVRFTDMVSGTRWDFGEISLQTGRIAQGVPAEVALQFAVRDTPRTFELHTRLRASAILDAGARRHVLEGFAIEATGFVPGLSRINANATGSASLELARKEITATGLDARIAGTRLGESVAVELTTSKLQATADHALLEGAAAAFASKGTAGETRLEVSAPSIVRTGDEVHVAAATMALSVRRSNHHFTAKAVARTDVMLHARAARLSIPSADVAATGPRIPMRKLAGTARGEVRLELAKEEGALELTGSVDASRFKADISVVGFASPVYAFLVTVDRLDVDRYTQVRRRSAKGPVVPDLSALADLPARGTLRIGTLKAAGMEASDVRVSLE